MDNNDLLRRLRFALSLDDAAAARLASLGGRTTDAAAMASYRLRTGEPDAADCPDAVLGAMLSGLVRERRGEPPAGTPAPSEAERLACDNNTVLKRIKTALSLRSEDILACIEAGGGSATASVVGAFLRRPDARNFHGLGDQMLRRFLSGLAQRERGSATESTDDT